MKVAVTGHTKGIGRALFDVYSEYGHEVIGFSRSNGFDISNSESRAKIVEQVKDCDIFFNNAHDWTRYNEFSEIHMLTDVWESWIHQKKTIINISSSSTMRWSQGIAGSIHYRTAKIALENQTELLWHKAQWPMVSIMAPCLTETEFTKNRPEKYKVDPRVFAKLVHQLLEIKEFRVQVLKVNIPPVE